MSKESRAKRRYDKQLSKKQDADKAIKATVKEAKASKTGMATAKQQKSILKNRAKSDRLQKRMNRIADRQTKKQSKSSTGFTDSNGAKVFSASEVVLSPKAYSMTPGSREKNTPGNFSEKDSKVINTFGGNLMKEDI